MVVGGASRLVLCDDKRDLDAGLVTLNDVVPAGATAIAYNLTVTENSGQGFLAVEPGGAAGYGGSAINWSPGQFALANASVATRLATACVGVHRWPVWVDDQLHHRRGGLLPLSPRGDPTRTSGAMWGHLFRTRLVIERVLTSRGVEVAAAARPKEVNSGLQVRARGARSLPNHGAAVASAGVSSAGQGTMNENFVG